MKSYKDLAKEYSPKEIAESFFFPGESNKKQREESLETFRKFRREAESKRSPKDKLVSRLLQLRFLMEDYAKRIPIIPLIILPIFYKNILPGWKKRIKSLILTV